MQARKILTGVAWVFGGVAIAAGMALVFGLIVMALWNWLMPAIFGLPTIAYWQAWSLVLLAHILFKSGPMQNRSRHPRHRDKWEENAEANKWENLTDEQKATRKMVNRLILGLVILGLVAFALFAWVAA